MQQLLPQLNVTGWRSCVYHRCGLCICRELYRAHRLRGWGHGEMVCAIVYIEGEERRAKDTATWKSDRDGVLCRILATKKKQLEETGLQIVLDPG